MRILWAIPLLALCGCSAFTRTVEVKVPYRVPCSVEQPDRPNYAFSPPYTDAFDLTKALYADRILALAYEETLRQSLDACR